MREVFEEKYKKELQKEKREDTILFEITISSQLFPAQGPNKERGGSGQ